MDDRLSYEKQRPASKHYLTDALDAVIAGKPVKIAKTDGVGCLVNFPERDLKQSHAKISGLPLEAPSTGRGYIF